MLALRSERTLRRGFFLFCIGIAVAVVTTLMGLPVRFGILQLLGVCMMLCGALRDGIARHTGPIFACVLLTLFAGYKK